MTTMHAAPGLCFVSTVSSHGPGGLAAYVRHLRRGLAPRWEVTEAARFGLEGPGRVDYAARERAGELPARNGHGAVRVIAPRPGTVPGLQQVHRLVNRPPVARLGVATFSAAYRSPLARAIPSGVEVMHFVGTGWELLGFPALREARRRGAAFTIWPAIHPGVWGDSPLDARLYRAADAVLAQSDFERRTLVDLGVEESKVHVMPLAPALERDGDGERFRRSRGLGRRPLVLFVGRRQRYKGYHALREAMAAVVEAVPDACLVSVGPASEPPFPDAPEGSHVDLGTCDEQEKADALAACDVFCMPSEGESFGIAYLEAWSFSKPVVAGSAPAVAELVRDGENGFRVDNAAGAIAPVLVRLLLDPPLRERLGAAGRELQRRRYTWPAVVEAHESIFRTVAGGRFS
jgi:glycosyltransferase involved in cell wall biosynthesis